jgi:hypothetical protein
MGAGFIFACGAGLIWWLADNLLNIECLRLRGTIGLRFRAMLRESYANPAWVQVLFLHGCRSVANGMQS